MPAFKRRNGDLIRASVSGVLALLLGSPACSGGPSKRPNAAPGGTGAVAGSGASMAAASAGRAAGGGGASSIAGPAGTTSGAGGIPASSSGGAGGAGTGAGGPAGSAGASGGAGAASANANAGKGAAGASGASAVGASGSASPALASPLLVPAEGVLLGIYYGDGSLAATEQRLGHSVPLHLVYYAWDDDWTRGATASDLAAGRIPLVNWEPQGVDFNDIVSGKLDATIQARASGARALGKPFFLDFAAEMNGDEAWGGNDPTLYVAAYRHIHDLFVAGGAMNVVWAWCPNVTDVQGGNAMTLDYYPGDDYVDWTGVDGYNWGTTNGERWQSFQQVFARIYPLLAGKGKPIMIGEMASAEQGGDKAAWIDAVVPTLKSSFPMIRALTWFDVNKETDWRIASSAASQAAFIRMMTDPYCNP